MTTIGIDLGTTNSLVSYWTDNGPKIIPNVHGANLTPSIVGVDENGEVYVGQIAKERLITHPHLTTSIFKRYMGSEKKYQLGKYLFTPIELSSLIIKSLKTDAETFLNEDINDAVISVPAYFNDSQRKATKLAAELAGLKVERLISEPTAAAISYGLHQASESKFLVLDLGGGTFDVSVLDLFEGVMDVKAIAGDNFLGGEDFTNLLASYFLEQNKIDFSELDLKQKSSLYKQAELCKYKLSEFNSGKMTLLINGQAISIEISRSEFENIASPLLLRLRQPIERVIRDADLSISDLDAIILIGGATRMNIIRTVVAKMFGKLPYTNINPDEAVALGASIQAALKERNEALDEIILTDICPYSLGTNVAIEMGNNKRETGYFVPIIERNTPIPVSRAEIFSTIKPNQKHVNVEVYQGESRRVENNIKLGELNFKFPPSPSGQQLIKIRYTYDINGILEVEAEVLKTGLKSRLIIEKSPGSMTENQIEECLKALNHLKIHPRDREENKLLLARGERLYEEALGDNRIYISSLLENFESILILQDDRKIKKDAAELKEKLDELERRYEY